MGHLFDKNMAHFCPLLKKCGQVGILFPTCLLFYAQILTRANLWAIIPPAIIKNSKPHQEIA
jgi:hypothetical protein